MESLIVILIPVLGRPANVAPVVASIKAATTVPHRTLFIPTEDDEEEIAALQEAGAEFLIHPEPAGRANFARKINYGFTHTSEPWLFQGADDIRFVGGWDVQALITAERTGRGVIGTNDLGNPYVVRGIHSTHTLISRFYIETQGGTVDGSGIVFSEAYAHEYCLPPESPIWMDDFSFREIADVKVGDGVVGWQRPTVFPSDPEIVASILQAEGSHRSIARQHSVSQVHVGAIKSGTYVRGNPKIRWRVPLRRLQMAEVLAIGKRESQIVRVTMTSGRTFRCTPDHRWLNGYYSPSTRYGKEWIHASAGKTLVHVIDPTWQSDLSPEDVRLAGWLGGIFDGEGSGAPNPQIAQSRIVNGPLYERICDALDHFGIPYTRADDRVWLKGGRRELVRFINIAQPTRDETLKDYVLGSRFGMKDKVVSVEPDGEGTVYSMTTSLGNYVAWGYASKNCDNEFVETAKSRGQFASSKRSVVEHLHPHWGKAEMDSTYEKATANTQKDRQLFSHRLRMVRTPEVRRQRQREKREARAAARRAAR